MIRDGPACYQHPARDQLTCDELMQELWAPIGGYEGLYEVSDQGRVRSLERKAKSKLGGWRTVPAKLLTPQHGAKNTSNHPVVHVRLSKDGVIRQHMVHHLVAAAFLGPRPEGLLVLHGDGGRHDNSAANLYYGDHSRNNGVDRWRDGTASVGENNACSKLTEAQVLEIRASDKTTLELAKEYGVCQATVSAAALGVTWPHLPGARPSKLPRRKSTPSSSRPPQQRSGG
jgi:hypothetical protein